MAFSWAECVHVMHWNIKPGLIKMTAGFKKSNPSKTVLPSPTGPLSLRMPSFCIELARQPTNAWQKSWREQATQRPSRPQNQPNEERMRSTHPKKRQRLSYSSKFSWHIFVNFVIDPSFRKAVENKRLNVRVGHKINQTRNVWEVTLTLCMKKLQCVWDTPSGN